MHTDSFTEVLSSTPSLHEKLINFSINTGVYLNKYILIDSPRIETGILEVPFDLFEQGCFVRTMPVYKLVIREGSVVDCHRISFYGLLLGNIRFQASFKKYISNIPIKSIYINARIGKLSELWLCTEFNNINRRLNELNKLEKMDTFGDALVSSVSESFEILNECVIKRRSDYANLPILYRTLMKKILAEATSLEKERKLDFKLDALTKIIE